MNRPIKYVCPKCGSKTSEIGEIRTASSFLTKIFNIQNRRFSSVSCTQCKYTEFYNVPSKRLGDVLDFIIGT
jgi:predicted nucleic-acid-binding Zn-ribbon protein